LASSPTEPHYFDSYDGTRIAWREMGEGRPLLLIHGYFSTASVNWIKYGHAALIAEAGFRVIMPDLRGHGDSAKPHDPAAYPPDALMRDGLALVAHLGLRNYDLAGYECWSTARRRGASCCRAWGWTASCTPMGGAATSGGC
jgi:pimeloyl-ACP methyl ester carboxylesterase